MIYYIWNNRYEKIVDKKSDPIVNEEIKKEKELQEKEKIEGKENVVEKDVVDGLDKDGLNKENLLVEGDLIPASQIKISGKRWNVFRKTDDTYNYAFLPTEQKRNLNLVKNSFNVTWIVK